MRKSRPVAVDSRFCKQANIRLMSDSLNRVMKDLPNRDVAQLFVVEFRGVQFNALPFLLNGAAYYDGGTYGQLLKAVAKAVPVTKAVNLKELQREKLLELKVLQALQPGSLGRREMWALFFTKSQQEMIKLLYQGAIKVMNEIVILNRPCHIKYQYKDICNTQAFSFYLTIHWLLGLDKSFRKQVDMSLRKLGFDDILLELCPEQSIHFQYIKGEISAEKLVSEYNRVQFDDDSSIAIRESYSNSCRGNYTGELMEPFQRAIGYEDVCAIFQSGEMSLNLNLSFAYLHDGAYDRLKTEVAKSKTELDRAAESVTREKQRSAKAQAEARELRKQNKELREQLRAAQLETQRTTSDVQVVKRVMELEGELKSAIAENNQLFDQRLALKQELSRRAKEIKKLKALIPEQELEKVEVGVDTDEATLEDMIEALKDKRIYIVGGSRSKTMVKTFEDWGFKCFVQLEGNVRKVDCDYLVICTILCSHSDMLQAERLVHGDDTELIYVNSVNVELVLRAIYEAQG